MVDRSFLLKNPVSWAPNPFPTRKLQIVPEKTGWVGGSGSAGAGGNYLTCCADKSAGLQGAFGRTADTADNAILGRYLELLIAEKDADKCRS